uniref:Vesicle transport protein n=1 Tax=Xiphophorus maculatus TaxID=8083 RepID=A0A3B5RDK4_XIPMA
MFAVLCVYQGVYVSFLPHFGTDLFVGLYAFGNIFALSSTLFLVGPVKQLKRMLEQLRIYYAVLRFAHIVIFLVSCSSASSSSVFTATVTLLVAAGAICLKILHRDAVS